jgi:hypothetical protein
MNGEPILIRCEGSGCPPAAMLIGLSFGTGICAMCGEQWSVVAGTILDHQRDDIIARLNRGDFK